MAESKTPKGPRDPGFHIPAAYEDLVEEGKAPDDMASSAPSDPQPLIQVSEDVWVALGANGLVWAPRIEPGRKP